MTQVSFITVTYGSADEIGPTLEALSGQLEDGDEVLVVDNESTDGTRDAVAAALPTARFIPSGGNPGFGAACNLGARQASGDLLVFLNPDAVPAPGFRAGMVSPLESGKWLAWMAVVTQGEGQLVNSVGGVVHFTGIAWAGGSGEPFSAQRVPDREPGFLSGAALAVPVETFLSVDGFSEPFFLYHEDVDITLRLRLRGGQVGVARDAVVDHAYEFDKGAAKWRWLERNRIATVIRTYPLALLVALMPALIATELALLVVAAAAGWLPQKLGANLDTIRDLPRLLRERRQIQSEATITAAQFAAPLVADLDSPFIGRASGWRPLRVALRAYWSVVLALLGGRS